MNLVPWAFVHVLGRLLNILNRGQQSLSVFVQIPYTSITSVAQKSSNLPRTMAVIYRQKLHRSSPSAFSCLKLLTNTAHSSLRLENGSVVIKRNPEVVFQVPVFVSVRVIASRPSFIIEIFFRVREFIRLLPSKHFIPVSFIVSLSPSFYFSGVTKIILTHYLKLVGGSFVCHPQSV